MTTKCGKKSRRGGKAMQNDDVVCFQGQRINRSAINEPGLIHQFVSSLYRESDGTLYAFRCARCKATWKIYQKACGCKHNVDTR